MLNFSPACAGLLFFRIGLAEWDFVGAFGLFVRVVAAADEGATLYVAEAHLQGLFLVEGELGRGDHALHRQVVLRGREVLSDGEDIHLALAEIAEDLEKLFGLFADADHESGLGNDVGLHLLGAREQVERALVTSSGACDAIEARHGLGVVIQDVGPRVNDDAQGLVDTLEVRDQDFDGTAGLRFTNPTDDVGENRGSADVVVIAIDAGDYGKFQSELLNGFGDAARLVVVDRFGAPLRYGAESAATRTEVTEQHEGRGLVVPALADVGALCRLADGVEVESAGELFEVVIFLAHWGAGLEPLGFGSALGRAQFNLDQLGSHESSILR